MVSDQGRRAGRRGGGGAWAMSERLFVLGVVLCALVLAGPAWAQAGPGEDGESEGAAGEGAAAEGTTEATPGGAPVLKVFEYNGKLGYHDARTGEVVLPARYAFAYPFTSGGVAAVLRKEGGGEGGDWAWAIIDQKGEVLLRPFIFDNGPDPFSDGLARYVAQSGEVGFYDETGKVVIPARYPHARPFHEGRAAFCEGCAEVPDGEYTRIEGGLWGFYDTTGKVVIPPRYRSVGRFEGGSAHVVFPDGEAARIDPAGRVLN